MRRRTFQLLVAAAALPIGALVLPPRPGQASLLSPEDTRFVVGMEGEVRALPPDEFFRRFSILMNVRDERLRDGQPNRDRQQWLERVRRRVRPDSPALEAVAAAVDWLRLGRSDAALDLLAPRLRDRRPDYFVYVTLGHIYADRGDWKTALRYHQEGLLDAVMPTPVPGLSEQQRQWWATLDREYVPHFYRLRLAETDARQGKSPAELARLAEQEDVLPLFPATSGSGGPVRFVNEQGVYEPGQLAAAERAKLPPDAIAIVQQMLFWFPGETRLFWLLGELYAADDQLDAAWQIFDSCTWGRQYGNRRILMEHRQAVEKARQARPRPTAADEPLLTADDNPPPTPEAPISMRTVWVYFAVVGVVALLALLRALRRQLRS